MSKILSSHARTWFFLVGSLAFASLSWLLTTPHAQTSCPPVSNNGWPKCVTVYYTLSGFNSTQTSQFSTAISAWDSANQTNNSRVKFVLGPPPGGGFYTLSIRTGTVGGGGPADTVKNTQTGAIDNATINFNLSATVPLTSPPKLVFDPSVSGYSTIFEKVLLHELGHTMGLKDVPVAPGMSCGGKRREIV